jgi:hypothetical protein
MEPRLNHMGDRTRRPHLPLVVVGDALTGQQVLEASKSVRTTFLLDPMLVFDPEITNV